MGNLKAKLKLMQQIAHASVRRSNYYIADQCKTALQKDKKWPTLSPEQQQKALAIVDEECNKQPDYSIKDIVKVGQVLKKRLTWEVERQK